MKFTITTVENRYFHPKKTELEKLGFTFELADEFHKVYRKTNDKVEREINSVDELMEIVRSVDDVVVYPDNRILIYDGYIE